MIKINLLNSYKQSGNVNDQDGFLASDEGDNQKLGIDFAKNAFVVGLAPLSFYFYEVYNISNLQDKFNEVNTRYNELKNFNDSKAGLADEIKKYMIQQAHFVAQADFINKIDRDKINEFKLFQHLKNLTPQSVWIERLELNENSLILRAQSDIGSEIESFIQRLSNSEVITNLTIVNRSTKAGYAGTDIETTVVNIMAQLTNDIGSNGENK